MQNVAVKFFVSVVDKPAGIPDQWPADIVELGESTTLPDNSGDWQLMTSVELAIHKAAYQAAYDTWFSSSDEAQAAAVESAKNQVRNAMAFGNELIVEFGAVNAVSELSSAQIIEISSRLASVQRLLTAGALQTAIDAMADVTTDELLSQGLLDAFAQKIRNYLGTE